MKKYLFIFYIVLFFGLIIQNSNSIENKIEFKINNEIVTSIDIIKELNFLAALNPKILELDKNKIFEISKNSIIKEKIKKLEIQKFTKKLEIDENYLKQLIQNSYTKINLNSEKEFLEYLSKYNLRLKDFKKKIIIEALWNQLIFTKYKSKITINEKKLKNEILKDKSNKTNSLNLSEIVFNVNENEILKQKYQLIKEDIATKGFENAALIYSNSETSNLGGKLGWIDENSISERIKVQVRKLDIGKFTDPIVIPGGFLIIKLNELKEIDKEIDFDKELKKRIMIKTNQQLNQFSNIYYNRIKKDKKIEKL